MIRGLEQNLEMVVLPCILLSFSLVAEVWKMLSKKSCYADLGKWQVFHHTCGMCLADGGQALGGQEMPSWDSTVLLWVWSDAEIRL
eukprot:g19870.t1